MSVATNFAHKWLQPRVLIEDETKEPITAPGSAAFLLYDQLAAVDGDAVGWTPATEINNAHIVVHLRANPVKDVVAINDGRLHLYLAQGTPVKLKDTDVDPLQDPRTWTSQLLIPKLWKIDETGRRRWDNTGATAMMIKDHTMRLARNYVRSHAIVRTVQQLQSLMKMNDTNMIKLLWGKDNRIEETINASPGFRRTTDNRGQLDARLKDLREQIPTYAMIEQAIVKGL